MKRIFAMLMLTLFLVAAIAVTASVAFADNPHKLGNSSNWSKKSAPCQNGGPSGCDRGN